MGKGKRMEHNSFTPPPKQVLTGKYTEETPRTKLLMEANGIVNKDRNSIYGNPEDNFQDIAELWSAYKGTSFSPMDVVIMNMLIKVARLKKTPGYRDGLVDIAGYAACGADIQEGMKQK